MSSIYKIKDLNFYYKKEQDLFRDFNCGIEQGRITGIIGPNGAGKSTLLHILRGIIKPHSGLVFLKDRSLHEHSRIELAQKIGILFSEYQFVYNYNVWEFVLMGRYPFLTGLAGYGEDDFQAADQAMKVTGISHLKYKGMFELSSGEKQIVLLTHILAQKPEILLLDEPFSHLDLKHQIQIGNILKNVKKTIIFVTHNITFMKEISDRVILLKKGKILTEGNKKILTRRNLSKLFDIKIN
ncbi:MAG: ABC transporter ATP-binding protein [Spirochaetes bacterium]|nr:ABC transporter ATP-binding protein [Spirochaetota bacterium]